MAKKTQRKAKLRRRKPAGNSFMVAWPSDLVALAPKAGKGPHKDVSLAPVITTATPPVKPRSP